MTAPAGLAEVTAVQAQLATLQRQIEALTPGRSTAAATSSAATFASALDAAGATTGADSGVGTATTGTTDAVTGASVVADAKQYLGIPYVWGAESSSGMDCSGLVQRTFADLGVHLPRVAADQAHVGTPVASLAQAQPGDLLFFGNPAHHVAIYAGGNTLIEAPQAGENVHLKQIYQTPTSIRRIVGSDAVASSTTSRTAQQLVAAGLNAAVAAHATQFAAAEQANGLPAGLLAAVAQQESGGNASAVSAAGAQGLMQLMPATAASHGVNAFDPDQAISAAAKIMRINLQHFGGSVPLALAAYNAGAGAVERYGGIPPYTETRNYVRRITAMMTAGG